MTLTICPLCGEPITDEDESTDVWGGTRPSGGSRVIHDDVDKSATRRAAGGLHILGYPIEEVAAVMKALVNDDGVEIETYDRVEEVKGVGSLETRGFAEKAPTTTRVETDTNTEKAATRLNIETPGPRDPDATMHEECYESVFNDDD